MGLVKALLKILKRLRTSALAKALKQSTFSFLYSLETSSLDLLANVLALAMM